MGSAPVNTTVLPRESAMAPTNASRFNPKRWTALTWLAVLLWIWQPFVRNFPPSESYTVDPVTGKLSEPTRYQSLSELPFPVGWPLYYVKPSYLTAPMAPVMSVGAPIPPPAPSTVHPLAMVANVLLVAVAIGTLVYFLQKTMYQYSLLLLLGVMLVMPLYIGLARLIALVAGYDALRLYWIAAYFSPVPAALAVRFSLFPRMGWRRLRPMREHGRHSYDDYANADDAIAAASNLEMRGDWEASINLYRHAAERWPEHSEYAQRCIDCVKNKQSLAQA